MKILIFAGGTGSRLWPLSRKGLPKQFKKMFNGGTSTLQYAVRRVERTFGTHNVYISTNENYVSLVKEQVPQIPVSNILGEPEKRDLAAAIGYNFMQLRKRGYKGPVAILWADHLMDRPESFIDALKLGEKLILDNPKQLVFVGENPRYAENNLGWIHIGKSIDGNVHEFLGWKYKPDVEDCVKMFNTGEWKWNPGYFIVDLEFTLALYEKLVPEIYAKLLQIEQALGTQNESEVVNQIYPTIEAMHFDKAIAEKVPADQAVVISTDMGWSDPGTLYALKEATIGQTDTNMTKGLVHAYETKDSLLINEDEHKLLTTVGLTGFVVVNTKDATIVVHKDNVREVSNLLKELEVDEKYKPYL